MTANQLIPITVRIQPALKARVQQLAAEQERTVQVMYARLIRAGLDLEAAQSPPPAANSDGQPCRRPGPREPGAGPGDGGVDGRTRCVD